MVKVSATGKSLGQISVYFILKSDRYLGHFPARPPEGNPAHTSLFVQRTSVSAFVYVATCSVSTSILVVALMCQAYSHFVLCLVTLFNPFVTTSVWLLCLLIIFIIYIIIYIL